MTLKQILFESGLLISHAFPFQVYNATDSLKATRAIYSFLGLNENFNELESGDKSLFLRRYLANNFTFNGSAGVNSA